jgi:P27 family predicted phage terminase small subunit
MAAGRPPKPTALKALQGNPGKRPLNGAEPQPSADIPEPPVTLKGEGRAEWRRVVPELARLGLVTKVDRAYLVAYCSAWGTFEAARIAMAEHGPLVNGRDGNLVKNPAAQVMRDAADMMIKFGARFGLSPSDRSRLAVTPPIEDGHDASVLKLLS